MAEIKIDKDEKTRSWTLATGQRHVIRIIRPAVDLVEVEDLHFHLDSAVILPDRDPADVADARSGTDLTSLSILRACYLHAKANPSKKVLCAGHADRSGGSDYNLKLSGLRARNVRAMLMGDFDGWTSICLEKHVVRDYQLILKWIGNTQYWPDCDPGPVDGAHGNGTSGAIRAFKRRFNAKFSGSLPDNTTLDGATWKALARIYQVALAGLMQIEESALDPYRKVLSWLSPDTVGCGEEHPITQGVGAACRGPRPVQARTRRPRGCVRRGGKALRLPQRVQER